MVHLAVSLPDVAGRPSASIPAGQRSTAETRGGSSPPLDYHLRKEQFEQPPSSRIFIGISIGRVDSYDAVGKLFAHELPLRRIVRKTHDFRMAWSSRPCGCGIQRVFQDIEIAGQVADRSNV